MTIWPLVEIAVLIAGKIASYQYQGQVKEQAVRADLRASKWGPEAVSTPSITESHASWAYNEPVRFEWDEDKARSNRRKHGVSFEEARTVFDDPLASIFDDAHHSAGERREIIIGHSSERHLLLVCFTERLQVVRIFSARRATKQEQKDYEKGIDIGS